MARGTTTKETGKGGAPDGALIKVADLDDAIIKGFKKRWSHDKKIKKAETEHVDPLKEDRNSDWDQLSTDTGIDKKDLNLRYALFKRQEEAKLLDEDDRDRILDNLRILHHGLAKGGMVDFVDALGDDFVPKRIAMAQAMASEVAEEEEEVTSASTRH